MATSHKLIEPGEPYPEQADMLPSATDIIHPYKAIELIFDGGSRTQLFTAGITQLYSDGGRVIEIYTRESYSGSIEGPFIQIHAGGADSENLDTLALSEFIEAIK